MSAHETKWNTVKVNGNAVVPAQVCARIEQERDAALRHIKILERMIERKESK